MIPAISGNSLALDNKTNFGGSSLGNPITLGGASTGGSGVSPTVLIVIAVVALLILKK